MGLPSATRKTLATDILSLVEQINSSISGEVCWNNKDSHSDGVFAFDPRPQCPNKDSAVVQVILDNTKNKGLLVFGAMDDTERKRWVEILSFEFSTVNMLDKQEIGKFVISDEDTPKVVFSNFYNYLYSLNNTKKIKKGNSANHYTFLDTGAVSYPLKFFGHAWNHDGENFNGRPMNDKATKRYHFPRLTFDDGDRESAKQVVKHIARGVSEIREQINTRNEKRTNGKKEIPSINARVKKYWARMMSELVPAINMLMSPAAIIQWLTHRDDGGVKMAFVMYHEIQNIYRSVVRNFARSFPRSFARSGPRFWLTGAH